jgi:hypothetical protein
MGCQTCDDLVAGYTLAVNLYMKSLRNLSGWAGDDFKLAVEQAERLWRECRNTDNVLMAHRRDAHCNLTPHRHN